MDRLHVQAPSVLVLLCGGECSDIDKLPPRSLRDAFLKMPIASPLNKLDLIQAESITKLSVFNNRYADLLLFETEFAQIMELIILFCESEGSLAELGSFVMIDEIAKRLFVVVRDEHWNADSFVRLGPLLYLDRKYGSDAVFVIDDDDVGVRKRDYSGIHIATLCERLEAPILHLLDKDREPTTFDPERVGHIIKLIVGLIQEYGALKLIEIEHLLHLFGASRSNEQIEAYLLCAEEARWIVQKRKGWDTYYISRNIEDAAVIRFKSNAPIRDKGRRRAAIMEHWKSHDTNRFRAIVEGRPTA